MEKLCLLFVKFETNLKTRTNSQIFIDEVNLITFQEMPLKDANDIKIFYDVEDKENLRIDNLNIHELVDTFIHIEIIKDQLSIKKIKEIFNFNNAYSSTTLNVVDVLRKYRLYKIYNDILIETGQDTEYFYSYSDESTSEILRRLYEESVYEDYDEFKNDVRLLEIINKIENVQGLQGIPLVKKDIESSENYDKNVIGVMESYLT